MRTKTNNRLSSQFRDTCPTMGQNHDGSNVAELVAEQQGPITIPTNDQDKKPEIVGLKSQVSGETEIFDLVEKQERHSKIQSKQALIDDILKGNFQPAYSKKDPKDLSQALQQVKEKLGDKPVNFRKAKQANTLLVYSENDGHLIESITLNRRGYYAVYADRWFSRSMPLNAIADQYSEKYGHKVFCKKITLSNYHFKQYVICEDIIDTINDRIDGITVYKQFSILASGNVITDENGDPITLDSLDVAKTFVKNL